MRGHDADHGILYINIICKGVGIQCHPVFTIVCCIRQYSIPLQSVDTPVWFSMRVSDAPVHGQESAYLPEAGSVSDHWHVPEYRHSAHNTVAGNPHCDCILHWHYRIPLCNSERHILFYCSLIPSPGITTLDAVSQIIVLQQCAIQPCCTGSLSVSLRGLTVTGTGVSPCRCAVRNASSG